MPYLCVVLQYLSMVFKIMRKLVMVASYFHHENTIACQQSCYFLHTLQLQWGFHLENEDVSSYWNHLFIQGNVIFENMILEIDNEGRYRTLGDRKVQGLDSCIHFLGLRWLAS